MNQKYKSKKKSACKSNLRVRGVATLPKYERQKIAIIQETLDDLVAEGIVKKMGDRYRLKTVQELAKELNIALP